MRLRLTGKVAFITGSSRGIGKAIALCLAKGGANVVLNASRSISEGKKTLKELEILSGRKHLFCQGDVSKENDIRKMAGTIKDKYGRIDILVNNAGATKFIPHSELSKLTPDIFDMVYKVNLRGPYLMVRECEKLLRKGKEPIVVNIASIGARTAMGSNIAYCAMKAGLVNMTKSLARALAPDIRVNSVSPGLTETDFIKLFGKYKAEQKKKTPLGRLAMPGDVAEVVLALVRDMTYLTGEDITVDGGRTLE